MTLADKLPTLRERVLPGVLVQILRECNYSCAHCSQDAPLLGVRIPATPLTLLLQRVDALFQAGHRRIRFTGGEPFLYPGLREAVSHAVGRGMEVSFVTNASRLGREEHRWLQNHRPLELWVSFYGYPPEVHDRTCGRRGAFGRTMTVLETLIKDGHKVGVHYPLSRASLPGCADFVDRMGRSGVMGVKIMQLFDQGRARREYSRDALDATELATLLPGLREIGEHYPNLDLRVSLRSGQRALFEERGFSVPSSVGCHAGLDSYWTTDAEGFVYPCCLFLNTASGRSVHLESPDLDRASDEYGHMAFLRQIGRTSPLAHCPAMDPDGIEESPEFICPLTYGRLVRSRRTIEPSP